MRIAVYCGSSFGKKSVYCEAAAEIGAWIADHGYELVYGGSERGLMGITADAAIAHHGIVTGVEPEFFLEQGLEHKGITRTIPCKTMSERKAIMIQMSDAYIALPGGPGTLDEISEVIVLAGLGREQKPCLLYNKDGYYDKLLAFYDQMVEDGFLTEDYRRKIIAFRSIEELDQISGTWDKADGSGTSGSIDDLLHGNDLAEEIDRQNVSSDHSSPDHGGSNRSHEEDSEDRESSEDSLGDDLEALDALMRNAVRGAVYSPDAATAAIMAYQNGQDADDQEQQDSESPAAVDDAHEQPEGQTGSDGEAENPDEEDETSSEEMKKAYALHMLSQGYDVPNTAYFLDMDEAEVRKIQEELQQG